MNTLNSNYYNELIEKTETFLNIAGNGEQFTIGFGLSLDGIFVKDKESHKLLFKINNHSDDFYEIVFVLNGIEYENYRCHERGYMRVNVNGDWMEIDKEKFDRDFDKFIQSYK